MTTLLPRKEPGIYRTGVHEPVWTLWRKEKYELLTPGTVQQGILETEAAGSSETSVFTYGTTRYHKPRTP